MAGFNVIWLIFRRFSYFVSHSVLCGLRAQPGRASTRPNLAVVHARADVYCVGRFRNCMYRPKLSVIVTLGCPCTTRVYCGGSVMFWMRHNVNFHRVLLWQDTRYETVGFKSVTYKPHIFVENVSMHQESLIKSSRNNIIVQVSP